jgi:general secretion pathway protein G
MAHKKQKQKRSSGFTLIELLVVISIISFLSSILFVSVKQARVKGQISRAKFDIYQLAQAAQSMAQDTGKWPNGCPVTQASQGLGTTEYLSRRPVVTPIANGCGWTARDVANWDGPYIKFSATIGNGLAADPWQNTYYFSNPAIIGDYRYDDVRDPLILSSCGPDRYCWRYDDNIVRSLK